METWAHSKALLQRAREKYRQVAELEPGDFFIWTDWAACLFKLARLEIAPEVRRQLVEEASAKYERATTLQIDDYELWCDWALVVLAGGGQL